MEFVFPLKGAKGEVLGIFFLSQSSQSSRSLFTHVSNPQKASGRQRAQSVITIVISEVNPIK